MDRILKNQRFVNERECQTRLPLVENIRRNYPCFSEPEIWWALKQSNNSQVCTRGMRRRTLVPGTSHIALTATLSTLIFPPRGAQSQAIAALMKPDDLQQIRHMVAFAATAYERSLLSFTSVPSISQKAPFPSPADCAVGSLMDDMRSPPAILLDDDDDDVPARSAVRSRRVSSATAPSPPSLRLR